MKKVFILGVLSLLCTTPYGEAMQESVAHDIGAYRDAPPGLRIWAGATVETSDIKALMPWIGYAFAEAKAALT